MAKQVSIEGLYDLHRGQPLPAAWVNAIVHALRQQGGLVDGVDVGDGMALSRKDKAASFGLHVFSSAEIPERSVFTIIDGASWGEPCLCVADLVDADSPLVYLTNGDVKIPAMSYGSVRPIGFERLTRLRYSGTAPMVNTECGPDLTTYAISQSGKGFVCLSEPDPGSQWVWVLRVANTSSTEGWWVLTGDLVQGGTASVNVISDDGSTYTGETVTVTDTALNTDETILSGTKIYVKKKGSIYIWTNARCIVSDTLPA